MTRDPYTFDASRPESWENYPAPYLAPHWSEELTEIAGRNVYGEPNLIFEWGCTALEEIDGEPGLKYYLCTTPPKYEGIKDVNGVAVPVSTTTDIGRPRWHVSRWMPPHEGWPRGRYVFFMLIEGLGASYSPVNEMWMEKIREHWHYTINRTDAGYAADVLAATTGVTDQQLAEADYEAKHAA